MKIVNICIYLHIEKQKGPTKLFSLCGQVKWVSSTSFFIILSGFNFLYYDHVLPIEILKIMYFFLK